MFCVHYYDVSAKIMTQETLRKYINGDASDEERLEVLHWVEESEDNRKELMAYRNLSNALIFNCDLERKTTLNERGKKRRAVIFRRTVEAIGVAAAIALGVFFGFRHHETLPSPLKLSAHRRVSSLNPYSPTAQGSASMPVPSWR